MTHHSYFYFDKNRYVIVTTNNNDCSGSKLTESFWILKFIPKTSCSFGSWWRWGMERMKGATKLMRFQIGTPALFRNNKNDIRVRIQKWGGRRSSWAVARIYCSFDPAAELKGVLLQMQKANKIGSNIPSHPYLAFSSYYYYYHYNYSKCRYVYYPVSFLVIPVVGL